MLLANAVISPRDHLNHAARSGSADGIAKRVALIERVERNDLGKQIGMLLVHEAAVVRVLDDTEVLGDFNNVRGNMDAFRLQLAGRALQNRADVSLPSRRD